MKFKPNLRLAEELEATDKFRRGMAAAVEPVAQQAEQFRGPGAFMPKTGVREKVVVEATRGSVRIVLTGWGAHLIEWGSKNTSPRAPLRRAARAAGLRFREQSK